jgi:tetratricopeptide (TPR) repeat protein
VAKVFISHAQEHAKLARVLASHLKQTGLEPWLALDVIQPGETVARAVQTAAQSADAAVLIIGPGEPTSWVRHEWSVILDAHWRAGVQKLVAVLLDDAASLGFLREAEVIRASSAESTWQSTSERVAMALHWNSRAAGSALASSEQLSERLDVISEEVRALEPDTDDFERRAIELRNLIAHADLAAVSTSDRIRLLLQLAALDMHLEEHSETERLLREAGDLLADDRPSERSAFVLYNLGVAVLTRGALEEASGIFRDAFKDCQAAIGPTHVLTAATAYNLGRTLAQLRQPDAAREYLETAVEVGTRTLGEGHDTVRTYSEALAGLAG